MRLLRHLQSKKLLLLLQSPKLPLPKPLLLHRPLKKLPLRKPPPKKLLPLRLRKKHRLLWKPPPKKPLPPPLKRLPKKLNLGFGKGDRSPFSTLNSEKGRTLVRPFF